jgi:hypothetical protein
LAKGETVSLDWRRWAKRSDSEWVVEAEDSASVAQATEGQSEEQLWFSLGPQIRSSMSDKDSGARHWNPITGRTAQVTSLTVLLPPMPHSQ